MRDDHGSNRTSIRPGHDPGPSPASIDPRLVDVRLRDPRLTVGLLIAFAFAHPGWREAHVGLPAALPDQAAAEASGSPCDDHEGFHRLDGRSYLDRTTLTPMPGGTVTQVIEVSREGGRSWEVTFDARYLISEGG